MFSKTTLLITERIAYNIEQLSIFSSLLVNELPMEYDPNEIK